MRSIPSVLAAVIVALGGNAVVAGDKPHPCPAPFDEARKGPHSLAVSLAGGGTKASSFGMGVLAALAREKLEKSALPSRASSRALWQTDLISSVSGGSYAGYFLFTRLIHLDTEEAAAQGGSPDKNGAKRWGEAQAAKMGDFFADCIPNSLKNRFLDADSVTKSEARRRSARQDQVLCKRYANAIREHDPETLENARKYWNEERPDTLHQQFLRCHQDVLAWQKCDFPEDGNDLTFDKVRSGFSAGAMLVVNLASMPIGWLANLVLDLPVNLSPSRVAYRDGIGIVFGTRPLNAEAILGPTDRAHTLGALAGTKTVGNQLVPDPDKLDFSDLAHLAFVAPTGPGDPTAPPSWVINATAAPSRHLLGWVSREEVNLDRHIFSMSARTQCSGSSAEIPIDHHTVWDQSDLRAGLSPRGDKQDATPTTDSPTPSNTVPSGIDTAPNVPVPPLLTAVNASGAFFDANQQRSNGLARFATAVFLQTTNLNWGIDLRNVNEDHHRRASLAREWLHEIPPFPAYAAEAFIAHKREAEPVFVHLVDGGSADNLGAYVPIVHGIRDIIISDHAQDKQGSMSDLCFLRNEIFIRKNLYLHIPGLEKWPEGCRVEGVLRRSRIEPPAPGDDAGEGVRKAAEQTRVNPDFFYPIWGWPYPFLAGCVSKSANPASCLTEPINRLWIIKPAFDFPYWLNAQTCLLRPSTEATTAAAPADQRTASDCITDIQRQKEAEFTDPQWLEREEREEVQRVVSRCGDNSQLPCESSAVLISQKQHIRHPPKFDSPDFPQRSTVKMTFNSDANSYGAYRELAHHYTKQAIQALDRVRADVSGKDFERILCWQGTHPIKGSADPLDLEFIKAWADIKLAGWDLATRNEARRSVGTEDTESYAEDIPDCASRLSASQHQMAADSAR
jgi:hypothetical protein